MCRFTLPKVDDIQIITPCQWLLSIYNGEGFVSNMGYGIAGALGIFQSREGRMA
jgi:hypothetical protein